MRILVTGGAGFIGSTYVNQVFKQHTHDEIVVLDALTYAGNLSNLEDLQAQSRFSFVQGDIADAPLVDSLVAGCDAVVNFAAETHVDRSLLNPESFLKTNVHGVYVLLEAVQRHSRRMLQVSTDEVYGDISDGMASTERDAISPRSPYSAAKAGGDLFCQSFFTSFGTDVVITRGCNTIGPRQYPEKLVPLFVSNALRDLSLPVYGDGMQVRDWMHAEDHTSAIDLVLRQGRSGDIYNVGAENERANIDVIREILRLLGKDESLVRFVPDRPGHDRRYALNSTKLREELGWAPRKNFQQTLQDTIFWYLEHTDWLSAIRDDSPEFSSYYDRQYGWRLSQAEASART